MLTILEIASAKFGFCR